MPDTDALSRFVRAAQASVTSTGKLPADAARDSTPCPTNRRLFLQRSLCATIAAGVLGAREKDGSSQNARASANTKAPGDDRDKVIAETASKSESAATAQPSAVAIDAIHEKDLPEFPPRPR